MSIISATIISLISAILSIVITQLESEFYISLISTVIFAISFMTIMLLLLIIKRTFNIYTGDS
jgi:hypothetical protein